MPEQTLTTDILVIGSGPGGSLSAALLAEAGRDVILVEEGRHIAQGAIPSYSLEEMDAKYRHGGLTVSMGDPKVAYVEGRCVGGASEINAGLYNRPLPQVLDAWAKDYLIKDFSSKILEPYFDANEKEMSISTVPNGPLLGSKRIADGAKALGWKAAEVPRMWDYSANKRQSMSETFIPRFIKANGRLLSQVRIEKLLKKTDLAYCAVGRDALGHPVAISFKSVFVCGGAIQTPLLLLKSGITNNVGNSLRMHPAVRVVAVFDEDVNDPSEGVPVYQVSEFKPEITLGGSYSGEPHLGLWLAGRTDFAERIKNHKRMAIFYALVTAGAKGTVRTLPVVGESVVNLPMGKADWDRLHDGLDKLKTLLTAAGAVEIIAPKRIDLSTIHLFSSCPMGEDAATCAVDSYGKLHSFGNIFLNDASILPTTPAANPQAVIMALARRNTEHFLGRQLTA
jgi:choline dehydrogenase-like flavoprotein